MLTTLLSFLAGLLTVLAPCVLPLLPVILGGSVVGGKQDTKRPYIITASLVVSLIAFTILLKASTTLIGIDPRVWSLASGLLVILLGVFMLMPITWAKLIARFGIETKSQKMLNRASATRNGTLSAILTGAALGPVFSSCSPTYAWVLATILPANTALGVFYLAVYCLGVAIALLAVALLGRRLLVKIKWASNPEGVFQRGIAVLFILVGVFVATGWDKKVQTWFVERDILNLIDIEQKLVPDDTKNVKGVYVDQSNSYFNVQPYPAPQLVGTGEWFNSEPLTLAELKGKVVLIDFWTYSCINCIRTLPYLEQWHETYQDEGLVIIGVHAPEFAFEKVADNVAKAVKDRKLTYPIVQDNDFQTWQAYQNRYWPAHYLIDKDGNVRREHFGEGKYEETEQAIRTLLAESGSASKDSPTISGTTEPPISQFQTPETYLGYERGERFANPDEFKPDEKVNYTLSKNSGINEWTLGGLWQVGATESKTLENGSQLAINFTGKEVYLVMSGVEGEISMTLNGIKVTSSQNGGEDVKGDDTVKPREPRLYKLIKTKEITSNGSLVITFPAGVTVNAFTFGS